MTKEEKKDIAQYYFNIIKKLINNKNDTKILIDNQFYYNKKAVDYVNKFDKRFFLNAYFDLTTLDILLMIDEANTVEEVKKQLFENYDHDYALALWENFKSVLNS